MVQLTDITNLTNVTKTASELNGNNEKIEKEFDKVLYTDGRNSLIGDLDFNGRKLLNLGAPESATDPVRLIDIQEGFTLDALAVPALTGNSGKFLRTDGSSVFWDSTVAVDPILDFGVDPTGATPTGIKLQAVLDYAYANDLPVVMLPDGDYNLNDVERIVMPSGTQMVSATVGYQYYPNSPYNTAIGTRLFKTNAGLNGPLVELNVGCGLSGLYLDHQKIGGGTNGIVTFGPSAYSGVCYNASITNCYIYGHAIDENLGTHRNVGCEGIKFPDSETATDKQRYFNRVDNCWVINCDRGYVLGENCNGNIFSNIFSRQVYRPICLTVGTATGECYGNVFTGLSLDNIGILPGANPVRAFTLVRANLNVISPFRTELYGQVFDMDNVSKLNTFVGTGNENGTGTFNQPNYYSRNFGWLNPYQTDLAQLRSVRVTGVVADGDTVIVRGQITDGDGGYGIFVFDTGSTATDDNLNVIKPVDLDTINAGRWVRLNHNQSEWNKNHVKLGSYSLWVDSTGDLRIKNGLPTSDTDGTIVGTQS